MKNSLKLSKEARAYTQMISKEARAYTQMISKAAVKTAQAITIHKIHPHRILSFDKRSVLALLQQKK